VEVEVQLSDLPQTPLFSQLPQEVMQVLLERLTMLPFAAGETIIREGEPGRSLFVIASGSAQVVRGQGEAREVLDTLPDGAFFGEIGLVADVPRLASVVALEDSVLLEVSRELVASLGARFPELEGLVRTFYKSRLLANLLRSNALFAQLEPAERGQLVEKFSVLRAAPGEVLLKQGAEGRGLFLLLRGRCGVTGRDSSGVEHPLPEMGEGAVMGEISLLSQKPVTATVTALTESVLLFLEPGPFVEHLLSNPRAREMVTRLSQERLQRSEALEQAAIEPAFL
jgi:CRP-like cAMP-binding protein